MSTLKQFRFAATLFAIFTVLLLSVSSCQKPCRVPNPLIEFGVAKDTVAVTPNLVSEAQTVHIAAFDATNAPKGNFTVAPGQQQKLHFDTSAQRPIQLVFTYLKVNGDTLAKDSIRINDILKKGISLPDMDIVVGVMAPGGQTCPTPSTTVTPTIVSAAGGLKKATFPWAPGDQFEVTLVCGGVTEKFRLNPEEGVTETDAGKVKIYGSNSFICLNLGSGDTAVESPKSIIITSISDDCNVRAYNDGSTMTITITYPGYCTLITVKK